MLLQLILLLLYATVHISAKVYDRCQLAHELKYVHKFPGFEIPTWICIIAHESIYDTAAMNPGSGDHGLFQISQLYWCSPPGDGFGCNAPCANFRDDDIDDDVKCVKRIFKEHSRISGDGFNAWAVYPLYCKGDTSTYIKGCFKNDTIDNIDNGQESPSVPVSTEEYIDEDDDGYDFPPLPSLSPKKKSENIISSDDDYYEFPPLPTMSREASTIVVPKREERVSSTYNSIKSVFDATVQPQHVETFATTKRTSVSSVPLTPHSSFVLEPVLITRMTQVATNEQVTTQKPILNTILEKQSKSTKGYLKKDKDSTSSFTTFSISHITSRPKEVTHKPFQNLSSINLLNLGIFPGIRSPNFVSTPISNTPSTARPINKSSVFSFSKTSLRSPFENNKSGFVEHLGLTTISPVETPAQYRTSTVPKMFTTQKQAATSVEGQIFSTTIATILGNSHASNFKLKPQKQTTEKSVEKTSVTTRLQKLDSSVANFKTPDMSPTKEPSTTINTNTLKRREYKYENEFPGYVFFRIGNGFKLVQNFML